MNVLATTNIEHTKKLYRKILNKVVNFVNIHVLPEEHVFDEERKTHISQ